MGDISAEPSMEDILSSIKRIIAEDGDGGPARGKRARPAPVVRTGLSHESDEILELNDFAPEPADAEPEDRAAWSDSRSEARSEPRAEIRAEQRADARAEPRAPLDRDPTSEPTAPPLVSPGAAQASRGSLDALTRMIARPDGGTTAPTEARTMDAFVADLLRPLLREWLDAHLPEIVEGMVAKEIARITAAR